MGIKTLYKFFFISLILGAINVQSQNYKVTYNLVFQPLKKDTLKTKENGLLQINKSKNLSFFEVEKGEKEISFNFKIYKNFDKKIFNKYEYLTYSLYNTNISFNPKNWNILNEKKNILGNKCTKAIINYGGRDWIAWFTEQIPFQDGPYLFYGLPGLILEITSTDNEYNFFAIGIENVAKDEIEIPSGIILKNEQLVELKKKAVVDPSEQLKQQFLIMKNSNIGFSVKFNSQEISAKDLVSNMNKDLWKWLQEHNNPIEKGEIWTN